jgi:hypothetical protein
LVSLCANNGCFEIIKLVMWITPDELIDVIIACDD